MAKSGAAGDTELQNLIDASLKDAAGQAVLIDHACDRLLRLTRKMFHGFAGLSRWERTDDIFQNSMIRLFRALSEIQVESVRHFFNLAATQIRRELLDLSKHHFGRCSDGANHHTDGQPSDEEGGSLHRQSDEPEDLEGWRQFHEEVERLPGPEREVFDLIYYEGLSQEDAAEILNVSVRTARRRWHSAKIMLHKVLCGDGIG